LDLAAHFLHDALIFDTLKRINSLSVKSPLTVHTIIFSVFLFLASALLKSNVLNVIDFFLRVGLLSWCCSLAGALAGNEVREAKSRGLQLQSSCAALRWSFAGGVSHERKAFGSRSRSLRTKNLCKTAIVFYLPKIMCTCDWQVYTQIINQLIFDKSHSQGEVW